MSARTHHPQIARFAVTEAARREAALRERDSRKRRVAHFIDAQRLSSDEAVNLDPQFDPGPEYDA